MKIPLLPAAALLFPTAIFAASPAEWRSQSIYFLLTDRFATTDNSTDASCDTDAREYCGGTWKGIINQLDYIQGMGFTALWITPVTEQIEEDTSDGTAYHGYWQKNLYGINENHGTADDLTALADALHDRGMYLMIDVVANHMGYAGAGSSVDYSIYNPFNSDSNFHSYCPVDDYDDQEEAENCWLGDDVVSLPDLDTQSKDVRNMFNDWIGELVKNYTADGLRIDTVKHVEKDFWPGFNDAAGVYCIGEVFDGDPDFLCPYQEVVDGLLNYLTYYPARSAFKSSDGSISELADMISTAQKSCADASLLGSFTENHDNARFPSDVDDVAQAKNLLAFTILQDGIPIVYYGQEQHFSGGEDPDNREALWTSGYDTSSPLYKLIATSNKLRNHAISKDKDYVTYKNAVAFKDSNHLAMRKGTKGSQVVTVLTNAGLSGSSDTLSVSDTEYEPGTKLTEVYTCASVTVDDSGNAPVPMESGAPRLLYPTKLLADSGLCED